MMNLTISFALFCAVLCSCYASCIAYQNCGSTLGTVTDVSVSGCQVMDARCTFTRGANVTLSIKFIPNVDISQVNVRMYSVVSNVFAPMSLKEPDVCKDSNSGVRCPLRRDQNYNYKHTIAIHEQYPGYFFDIKLELVDEEREKIACVIIPVQIGILIDY